MPGESMRLTNKLNLPQPIFDAIKNDTYDRGEADISVTTLLQPPRKVELDRQHEAEREEDASDRIFSLLGQVMHGILERSSTTGEAENRHYMTCLGWRVSGQIDRVIDGVIEDYKFVTVYKVRDGVDPDYEKQVNLYAELLRSNGADIRGGRLHAILRDWSKREARFDLQYPQTQIVTQEILIWPREQAVQFLEERIRLHQAARQQLPECSSEERWATTTLWAVMKKGNVRATKLYKTEQEAQTHASAATNFYVEKRPGENKRCADYCSASKFCSQYQSTLKKEPS